LWFDNEIEELVSTDEKTKLQDASDNDRALGDKGKQIKAVLYADDLQDFEMAIKATGLKNRGMAIMEICRFYLVENEKGQLHSIIESIA